jgi:ankyrin repeat protein
MLTERKEDLAGSLVQSASSIPKDTRWRTALHLSVLHDNLQIMQQACRYRVDINSKDGDGNSPIQLSFQETKSRAIDWLLENSAKTADITREDWLHAYATQKSFIVVLSGETLGPKKVIFLTRAEFETSITFHPQKWKRLL